MPFEDLLAATDVHVIGRLAGAQSIRYLTSVGTTTVSGIFDRQYMRTLAGTAGVMDVSPAVFLRLADLPTDPLSDGTASIEVDGVAYSIVEPQVDATGGVLLILHNATADAGIAIPEAP